MSFATDLQALKNAINTFSVKIKNKFDEYIPLSLRNAINGVAPLDENRLVPIANIPGIHKNYDLHNFVNGKPLVYEVLMRAIAVRAFTIPANCAGSFAYCTTPATSAFSIGILKNGVQIGTINYAAGATAATFTLGTALVLNPGDQFALKCIPGTQDATLSDLAIAIYADAS